MTEITTITMADSKYGDCILLDEYNGQISIVSAREGKDGKTYPQWAFPQDKDRKPRDKAIPLKVTLGDRDTAIRHLRYMLDVLEGGQSEYEPPVSQEAPFDDDPESVPF